jgi:hypothetical protein
LLPLAPVPPYPNAGGYIRGCQRTRLVAPTFQSDATALPVAALAPKLFSARAAYFIHEVSHRVQPRVEVLFCLILRNPITLLDYSL